MKRGVLDKPIGEFEKRLRLGSLGCRAMSVVAVLLNVLVVLLRNEGNHSALLILNIGIDILVFGFCYTYKILNIDTQKVLLRLYRKERSVISGEILEVSESTKTYMSIECREVNVDGKILFVPVNTIALTNGEKLRIFSASNVIVEVEDI